MSSPRTSVPVAVTIFSVISAAVLVSVLGPAGFVFPVLFVVAVWRIYFKSLKNVSLPPDLPSSASSSNFFTTTLASPPPAGSAPPLPAAFRSFPSSSNFANPTPENVRTVTSAVSLMSAVFITLFASVFIIIGSFSVANADLSLFTVIWAVLFMGIPLLIVVNAWRTYFKSKKSSYSMPGSDNIPSSPYGPAAASYTPLPPPVSHTRPNSGPDLGPEPTYRE